jgi:hypothetical protein
MTVRRLLAAALVAVVAACSGDDDPAGPRAIEPGSTTTEPTTTTTEAPFVGQPLVITEQGVSTFPDPFDPSATLGGYAVVLHNPNPDRMATGVQVRTRVLDAAGTELLVDNALLNAVMPGERMAVGRTVVEPIVAPTQLDVQISVGAWLRPSSTRGELAVREVVTEPEEGGGSITRFTIRSTWPENEEGVDVTAVYRAADGRILGAESTTIPRVPTRSSVEGQIRLLSPIPELASTEVFVGRGFTAQTSG